MTPETFEKEISAAVPVLLKMAREVSWNEISSNRAFILSEETNSDENFHELRKRRLIENARKTPKSLDKVLPVLKKHYDDIYDINLYVYQALREVTIIDIRYYLKTSLEKSYRKTVASNAPMLHCKVTRPCSDVSENEKFDINWEHTELSNGG